MKRIIKGIIIIAIVSGCNSPLNSNVLIGEYSLNNSLNNDRIHIRYDRTYTHKYLNSKGRSFEWTGKWKFDSTNTQILFENFVFFNETGSEGLPPGNWFSKVDLLSDGHLHLIYSSENDIYFLKQ